MQMSNDSNCDTVMLSNKSKTYMIHRMQQISPYTLGSNKVTSQLIS